MTVRVLLFARYREAAGAALLEVDVRPEATLAEVWDHVLARVPALSKDEHPLFSCDRTYARGDRIVTGREEIAIFPPVGGG